jgi:hypothetical protein
LGGRYQLDYVTGTAAGQDTGSTKAPRNLRSSSGQPASATFLGDTGVTGLTAEGNPIAIIRVGAKGEEDVQVGDAMQVGPGDALAIKSIDTGLPSPCEATFLYFFDLAGLS